MKFKYPLPNHEKGGFYPPSGNCGYCGKSNDGKFVIITMSSMEQIPGTTSFAPSDSETSFELLDHGVTQSGKGLVVFKNTSDAYFCSIKCLRNFFNRIVDDFEAGE